MEHHRRHQESVHEQSRGHRVELERRGYGIIAQLFLDDSFLIRNSPWKTYWRVRNPDGIECFVKVNYGYRPRSINEIMGTKEARLPELYEPFAKESRKVRVPEVMEHWKSAANASFVVHRWYDLTRISLQQCLGDEDSFSGLLELLHVVRSAPRPSWWNSALETHRYSGRSVALGPLAEGAFFGFDLDDNLYTLPTGELFFSDFEFFQWERCGLQEIYLSTKILCTARRELVRSLGANSKVRRVLEPVEEKPDRHALIDQAVRAWRDKLQRGHQHRLRSGLRAQLARQILHWLL